MAFSDEEGVRFHTTFLGSRVFSGTLPPEVLHAQDSDGITLEQARTRCLFCFERLSHPCALQALLADGAATDATALKAAIRAAAAVPERVRAYVEVHIEQGPVLEDMGLPLGVVTAIAGQTFLSVSMRGTQGHAGTVPMATRRDTLAAAAEAVLRVETRCKGASGCGPLYSRLRSSRCAWARAPL